MLGIIAFYRWSDLKDRPCGLEDLGKTTALRPKPRLLVCKASLLICLFLWLTCPGGLTEARLGPAGHPWISGFLLQIEQKTLLSFPLQGGLLREDSEGRRSGRELTLAAEPPGSVAGGLCPIRETLGPYVPHFPHRALEV